MSDLADSFRKMTKEGQAKRAFNRRKSTELLVNKGIRFTSHNNGAHLIVDGPDDLIDFWPGTGRWKTRDGVDGFGMKGLLNYMEILKEE